jgi:hypothetical protein
MRHFCKIGIWLLCLVLFSSPALANFEKGLDAYKSKDYSRAYKILGKAAKSAKGKRDRARAMALMGAAAAKMGKKNKARSLFASAVKLDEDVELNSAALKDKSVRKLFDAAKGGSDDSGGSRTAGKSGDFTDFSNYYPLGINQYVRGKTLLAGAFGGGQVLGLFLYLDRSKAASDADADASAVIAQAEADNTTSDPQFLDFLNSNEAFVKKARSEATLGLFLALGSYSASVIESLFDPFGLSKKGASLYPTRGDRFAGTMSVQETHQLQPSWDLDVMFIPTPMGSPLFVAAFTSKF